MDYNMYSNDYMYEETAGVLGLFSGIATGIMLISILISLFNIIVMWKIFKKAGKPGWASLIPIYNIYVLFEITWGNGWIFLSMLAAIIPVIGWIIVLVINIITYVKLSKSFGKSGAFAVGLIFLNIIFMAILAFDSSKYLGVQKQNDQQSPNNQPPIPNNNQPTIQNQQPIQQPIQEQQQENLFQIPQGTNTTINNIEIPQQMTNVQQQENVVNMVPNNVETQQIIPQPNINPQESKIEEQPQNIINPVQMAQQLNNQEQYQQPANTNGTITCPYCNSQIDQNAIFCTNCGKQLK